MMLYLDVLMILHVTTMIKQHQMMVHVHMHKLIMIVMVTVQQLLIVMEYVVVMLL